MTYDNYPPYPQLWGDFEPRVSIVDLLLNTGPHASTYLERQQVRELQGGQKGIVDSI